jgi:hypothetical protein
LDTDEDITSEISSLALFEDMARRFCSLQDFLLSTSMEPRIPNIDPGLTYKALESSSNLIGISPPPPSPTARRDFLQQDAGRGGGPDGEGCLDQELSSPVEGVLQREPSDCALHLRVEIIQAD